MKPCPVSSADLAQTVDSQPGAPYRLGCQRFDKAFQTALEAGTPANCLLKPANCTPLNGPAVAPRPFFSSKSSGDVAKTTTLARAAYGKRLGSAPAEQPPTSDWQKYKEDQLLRNPGGRDYTDQGIARTPGGKTVSGLIAGDLSGAVANIGNFFANIFKGSKTLYRDEKNQIRQHHQTGLLGTMANFFRDFASALSLGAYHPGSPKPVQGAQNRLLFSASKLKDAFLGDIATGVPASVNHMAQNAILAGWRLVEVLPDAAIGGFGPGRKLTTTIFDNGQVAVEYLTDIIPSGDAWLRVHGADWKKLTPPVLYNLKMPEHFNGDARWKYIRNTPFRKTIETIGSLLADGLAIGFLGQTGGSSDHRSQIEY
ncbi:MAG: hypothetical protein P4L43_10935 [Syntrophobacteraceae bacterium]|nr:hypothetical protein [Syntrophobacteraceae bacterium]